MKMSGLTEGGLYKATAAMRSGPYWYITVTDDEGAPTTALAVSKLPEQRDTLIEVSHKTRFRIAVDYDPAEVVVV